MALFVYIMNSIQNKIKNWQSKGSFFILNKHRIWYLDHNPKSKEVICILHGYPTCSYDYFRLIDYFPNHRIIVHDHLGFGLSDKPISYGYLLKDQVEVALKLYQYLKIKSCCLLAHDYGSSVATEILAQDNQNEIPIHINKLILSNGSMLIDMSKLRPIQKMLKHSFWGPIISRLATRRTFVRNMKDIWYDPSTINEEDIKVLWQFLIMKNGRKVLSKITRYIDQRYENYERWIGALKNTQIETLILWGHDDPIAVVQMADVLSDYIQNNIKVILPHTGHYPMIEKTEIYANEIHEFLNEKDI